MIAPLLCAFAFTVVPLFAAISLIELLIAVLVIVAIFIVIQVAPIDSTVKYILMIVVAVLILLWVVSKWGVWV